MKQPNIIKKLLSIKNTIKQLFRKRKVSMFSKEETEQLFY